MKKLIFTIIGVTLLVLGTAPLLAQTAQVTLSGWSYQDVSLDGTYTGRSVESLTQEELNTYFDGERPSWKYQYILTDFDGIRWTFWEDDGWFAEGAVDKVNNTSGFEVFVGGTLQDLWPVSNNGDLISGQIHKEMGATGGVIAQSEQLNIGLEFNDGQWTVAQPQP